MTLFNDHESNMDLSKHRIVDLDNGNRVHLERRDPYGFIHCWLDKGAFPDKSPLQGVFTDWKRAYEAVEGYLTERNAVVAAPRQVSVTHVHETIGDVETSKMTPNRPKTEAEDVPVIEKTTEAVKLKVR